MLELLDPAELNDWAFVQDNFCKIAKCSANRAVGWNYCMDYSWVAMQLLPILCPGMVILDIGCGPGGIHRYLEQECGVDIIGIDRDGKDKWGRDYVDIVGDFCESNTRHQVRYRAGRPDADVIMAVSAFEHNDYAPHRAVVDACFDFLRPGGLLVSTISTHPASTYTDEQWNLERYELETIYRTEFFHYDYDLVRNRWRTHSVLAGLYRARYAQWRPCDPHFITAGARVTKP